MTTEVTLAADKDSSKSKVRGGAICPRTTAGGLEGRGNDEEGGRGLCVGGWLPRASPFGWGGCGTVWSCLVGIFRGLGAVATGFGRANGGPFGASAEALLARWTYGSQMAGYDGVE